MRLDLKMREKKFFEFFCGGGMVSQAVPPHWRCIFANDIDIDKSRAFIGNNAFDMFIRGDIRELKATDLPQERVQMAWASFPCQDISIAGPRTGLSGERSSLFWEFYRIIDELGSLNTINSMFPETIVLENVTGLMTSKNDLRCIYESLYSLGYVIGFFVIDAKIFLPQSRQRIFIVCVRNNNQNIGKYSGDKINELFTPKKLIDKISDFTPTPIFWNLPEPKNIFRGTFVDILEDVDECHWDNPEQTKILMDLMTEKHHVHIRNNLKYGCGAVTCLRRTRNGKQVVEVRPDGIAACLRKPVGGSSMQKILCHREGSPRSRYFTPRECARLMGLDDSYKLPESNQKAYTLLGDGVAVPVVRHLMTELVDKITD